MEHDPTATSSTQPPQTTPLPVAVKLANRISPARPSRAARTTARVREFIRPDHLKEFGTTLALVAPLTVLIWVWAEREQAVEVPDKRTFAIAVRASNPTQTVSLAPGESDTVIVELKGPRAGVEGIKDAISKDSSKSRLAIDIGDIFEPGGPYPVVLDSLLDKQKIFSDYGLTVHAVEPTKLMVLVDRQVERDVPVKLPAEIADGVQTATFEPKTVKVRGPERIIKQLEANGALTAQLDIANLTEMRRNGGVRSDVPLRTIEGVTGVTMEPAMVSKVSLQLSQEEQGEIRSMIVFVSKAAGLEGRATVQVTPLSLTGVKVSGPSDALRLLREEKVTPPPYAEIKITLDDIGTRGGRRMPTVEGLPPGVRVIPSSINQVTFDVTAVQDAVPLP